PPPGTCPRGGGCTRGAAASSPDCFGCAWCSKKMRDRNGPISSPPRRANGRRPDAGRSLSVIKTRDARGFVLLIVLWSVGLLALLGAQLTATARVQLRMAMVARDTAIVEAAADGAIRQAMFAVSFDGRTPVN